MESSIKIIKKTSQNDLKRNISPVQVGCALMNATTTTSQIVHMTPGKVREIGNLKTGLPEMLVFLTLLDLVLLLFCFEQQQISTLFFENLQ